MPYGTLESERVKTMFEENQTSLNIILPHAMSCNIVAKEVQHVTVNSVAKKKKRLAGL